MAKKDEKEKDKLEAFFDRLPKQKTPPIAPKVLEEIAKLREKAEKEKADKDKK